MAKSIAIVGDSGSGKSTSMAQMPELGVIGLNPKETFIINIKGKDLPFRGWKKKYLPVPAGGPPSEGNYLASTDPDLIVKVIQFVGQNRPDIKNVVVDDGQYVMGQEFMDNANKTGFEKFTKIAKHMFDVINAGITMPGDKVFFLLTHSDEDNGMLKMKTIGKLLDEKIVLAGLFTYVLFTVVKNTPKGVEYKFATNRTQDDRYMQVPAKSPIGVFEEILIPNDLGYVLERIEEYENSED